MRALVVLLVCVLALWGVLGALHVVPLPFGLLERGAGSDEATDELDLGGEGAGGGVRLEGQGGARRKADAPLVPVEPQVPPEVRGSVPKGAAIRGRVVTAGTSPVPLSGVKVRLLRPNPITAYLKTSPEGRWDVLEARTGTDGRFAFLDVRAAKGYVVRASQGERAPVSSKKLDLVERQIVDLGDLTLGGEAAAEGRVIDGEGKPIAGADVAITWQVETILGTIVADVDTLPEVERRARTDAEGLYRLPGLEPGMKTLLVVTADRGAEVRARVPVEAGAPTRFDDVILAGQGVVAGRVEWENGKPVEGARVFAADGAGTKPALLSCVTGADGAFRIEHLPVMKVHLGAFLPGIPVRPSDEIAVGTLDVVLRFPVAGSLKGRVVRAAGGAPVQRFKVFLAPQDKEEWMAAMIRRFIDQAVGGQGFTTTDGRFEIPLVASGPYVVTVSASGYPDRKSDPIVVTPGAAADVGTIELAEGFGIEGHVRNSLGTALENARVQLLDAKTAPDEGEEVSFDEESAPDATTDAEGHFELPPQTPGRYALYVSHPLGVDKLVKGVDLSSGPKAGLDVRLEAAGRVRVRLLDAAGKPAFDEEVYLVRADGYGTNQDTDENGEARFDSVPPGPCVVRFASRSLARALRTVTLQQTPERERLEVYEQLRKDGGEESVAVGAETVVTLRLPARVAVTIKVEPWEPDRRPIQYVSVQDPTAWWWDWTRADGKGQFVLQLEPGTYEMRAVPESGWNDGHDFPGVVIPDAATHTVELR